MTTAEVILRAEDPECFSQNSVLCDQTEKFGRFLFSLDLRNVTPYGMEKGR